MCPLQSSKFDFIPSLKTSPQSYVSKPSGSSGFKINQSVLTNSARSNTTGGVTITDNAKKSSNNFNKHINTKRKPNFEDNSPPNGSTE